MNGTINNETKEKEQMKKEQSREEMINLGASEEEIKGTYLLIDLLRPCLKLKQNGRYDTSFGDKTALGLYRTIGSHIFS